MSDRQLAAWRARHVGLVFQFYNLLPVLTAERNVELPLLLTHLSKAERREHVETALRVVGLPHRARHFPRTLSGGEQQRVGIARAIVTDPTLLLCDEPTGDLDRKSGDEILALLQALNQDHGKTVIMVTHDPHASAQCVPDPSFGQRSVVHGNIRMKFLSLVWSNLHRKKLRTWLTLLSIFVAFILFGLLCAIKEAFTAGVTMAGADRLIVRHKVSLIMFLPESYGRRIQQIPGVASAVHMTWFNGIYQNEPKNFFGSFPVSDPEAFLEMYPEFLLPEEQKQAWLKTRTGAVVGRSLANRFNWKIGDRVPLTSPIWPNKGGGAWEFDIVGIYDGAKKGTDTSGFDFRYDYFNEGRAIGEGEVGWYVVRVDNPERAEEVAQAIDREFANSPYETKAEPEGAFAQGFVQQIGDIGTMLIAILSAVFFTILLVAGNTMAQAVRERTQELGVLKALGFTNRLVLALVLAESCLIAAVGGLLGLAVAWLITAGGSPIPSILPVFYLPYRDLTIGVMLAFALGIVAGILPASEAMRLRIAVALRRHA